MHEFEVHGIAADAALPIVADVENRGVDVLNEGVAQKRATALGGDGLARQAAAGDAVGGPRRGDKDPWTGSPSSSKLNAIRARDVGRICARSPTTCTVNFANNRRSAARTASRSPAPLISPAMAFRIAVSRSRTSFSASLVSVHPSTVLWVGA
jgi:hypothetical protein